MPEISLSQAFAEGVAGAPTNERVDRLLERMRRQFGIDWSDVVVKSIPSENPNHHYTSPLVAVNTSPDARQLYLYFTEGSLYTSDFMARDMRKNWRLTISRDDGTLVMKMARFDAQTQSYEVTAHDEENIIGARDQKGAMRFLGEFCAQYLYEGRGMIGGTKEQRLEILAKIINSVRTYPQHSGEQPPHTP